MTGQTCQSGLSGGHINFLLSVGFRGWGEDTKRMQINRALNRNSSTDKTTIHHMYSNAEVYIVCTYF